MVIVEHEPVPTDVREHWVPIVPPAALVGDVYAVTRDKGFSAFEAFDLKSTKRSSLGMLPIAL